MLLRFITFQDSLCAFTDEINSDLSIEEVSLIQETESYVA